MPSSVISTLLRPPATGLRALTLSAGVGTRAERLAALTGIGGGLNDGFDVYPAANAAVLDATLNGNFETNTTGWTDKTAGGVLGQLITDAKFGSACLQTVNDGTGANQGPITSAETGLTAGNVYTLSLFGKSVSGAVTVRVQIDWLTVLDAAISSSTSDITLTAAWQRFILTATAAALGVHAKISVINLAATAATYNIDGVQFDNGSVALPFDPANTRVAGRVQLPVSGLFTATQGAVAARFRMGTTAHGLLGFDWRDGGNGIVLQYSTGAGGVWFCQRTNGASSDQSTFAADASWVVDDRRTAIARWQAAAGAGISLSGAAFVDAGTNNIPTMATTSADFASLAGTSNYVSGALLWAIAFKGTPTNADAALPWMVLDAVPTVDQIRQLSFASKPTLLIARTQDAILLPAFFEGAH